VFDLHFFSRVYQRFPKYCHIFWLPASLGVAISGSFKEHSVWLSLSSTVDWVTIHLLSYCKHTESESIDNFQSPAAPLELTSDKNKCGLSISFSISKS
jgi:hypothetical protein